MRSAAMRTPSESTSPKPSRSPIRWISSTIDSWLPKCRSMPPVSSSVKMPRSKSSMAKAMVTPADIVSRPYSSAARSAAMMASGSVTPVVPPNE